jgi:hypothetical protein
MLKRALIAIFTLLIAVDAFAADDAPPVTSVNTQVIRYDAATDRLSLDVHDLPLTLVLARISRQSGVEILADPSVDQPVTASLQNRPLEDVLGELTRGMNAVMIHDQPEIGGQGKQPVLVRMEILPVGQANTALLRPVLSPGAETLLRGKGRDAADHGKGGFLKARRQARLEQRLANMDPAQREKYEKHAAAQARRQAKAQAARAERKAQRKQNRLERLNARLAHAEAQAATNPQGSKERIQRLTRKIAQIQQDTAPATAGSTP